jgi:hypothetical protein
VAFVEEPPMLRYTGDEDRSTQSPHRMPGGQVLTETA